MEMNRLGMLIDLAHVPVEVMNQVLDMSKAPVIFSHSSAYDVCKHKRNVPNEVIKKVVSVWRFYVVTLKDFPLGVLILTASRIQQGCKLKTKRELGAVVRWSSQ